MAGGALGGALAAADSRDWVRGLGDWCWSWSRGNEGRCQQSGEGCGAEDVTDRRHCESREVVGRKMNNVEDWWNDVVSGTRES